MAERHVLTTDGAWCWFQDPRAVRHVGERDRTYLGWITRTGDVEVGAYDHGAETMERTVLHPDYEEDDHDAPALHVDRDGRLLVFYTRHAGPEIHYRRSVEPEDVSAFEPERSIAPSTQHTYANPQRLDATGELYLFYRNEDRSLACVASADDGETWSDERELISTTGWRGDGDGWVYFKLDGDGHSRIDVALSHYDYALTPSPYRDVRHVRFDGEALAAADGTAIADGSEPVDFTDCPPVYETSETGYYAWVWDCATHDDAVEIAYAELRPDDEHRYRFARWDSSGDGWLDVDVTDGGHNIRPQRVGSYSGGVVLDHDDPGTLYLSTGDYGGSRVQRWARGEGGDWRVSDCSSDRRQNVRPVVPRNRHPDLPVVWMQGRYDYFANREYDTRLVTWTDAPPS